MKKKWELETKKNEKNEIKIVDGNNILNGQIKNCVINFANNTYLFFDLNEK